ncbi:hypothetical protein Tco_0414913 [Tanacetum coccineum]
MSYLVPLIAVVFVAVVGYYLACVPQEEDHQYLVVILGLIVPLIIVVIGMEVFWKKIRSSLSTVSALKSVNLYFPGPLVWRSNLSGLSSDLSQRCLVYCQRSNGYEEKVSPSSGNWLPERVGDLMSIFLGGRYFSVGLTVPGLKSCQCGRLPDNRCISVEFISFLAQGLLLFTFPDDMTFTNYVALQAGTLLFGGLSYYFDILLRVAIGLATEENLIARPQRRLFRPLRNVWLVNSSASNFAIGGVDWEWGLRLAAHDYTGLRMGSLLMCLVFSHANPSLLNDEKGDGGKKLELLLVATPYKPTST